ncbi:hypothetical protein A2801_04330 [Candidatus Woesebacteria bacterium RIFCSPHIGHO2_01_FULL_41_10]|uniref:Ribulose-phosphate 3-epimerase n=1 Tax=Candidatus Woesebacteria bacterium RIFCSPHIGHO2_01_FULL_41_10 TaxID=1802500 RepID=A0A1F7YNX7_9BACT|nr:MAG: hypothetical protein A2801_04330 [Candidatus Woesebacteria bacterium RIFCSPHIGHO2_01_FULL_41_10]
MSLAEFEIIPGILTSKPEEFKLFISRAEGVVRRVQIDVIDGVYADNKTVFPEIFDEIETRLSLDFHLMVNEPVKWVEKCIRAGADRIIGQIEMMGSQREFVEAVARAGIKPGLAIDIDSSVGLLDDAIQYDLDVVLVMSVPAGYGGQKFHEEALEKIHALDLMRKRDQTPFRICDDGGVTMEYVDDLRSHGADEVVIGKRIFAGNLKKNVESFIARANMVKP